MITFPIKINEMGCIYFTRENFIDLKRNIVVFLSLTEVDQKKDILGELYEFLLN